MIRAGIDIGTNTFRLLVAEVEEDRLRPLVKLLSTVRLGRGLGRSGRLAAEAVAAGLKTLAGFQQTLAELRPETLRVCATEAMRLAVNRDEFLPRASAVLGTEVEVISSREEGLLGLRGARAGVRQPFASGRLGLFDVGGGSTEVVFAGDPQQLGVEPDLVASLPLGAVGLSERFLLHSMPSDSELDAMSEAIAEAVAQVFDRFDLTPLGDEISILGIGGTATALAALDLELDVYDGTRLQDHRLRATDLEQLWQRLRHVSATGRNRLPGLGQGRGEIILAGLRIYQLVLQQLGTEQMLVSDSGLLEGIVLSGLPARGSR